MTQGDIAATVALDGRSYGGKVVVAPLANIAH
jgi:hypothetical protein